MARPPRSFLALLVAGVGAAALCAASCSGGAFTAGSQAGASGSPHAGFANAGGGDGTGDAGAPPGGASNANAGAGASDGGVGNAGASGGGVDGVGEGGEGGACNPRAWFPDGDGDGAGRTTAKVLACAPPSTGKWVAEDGDCNDDNALVYPAQPDFKAEGYPVTGGVSFDYDCSGQEEADSTQIGAAPACANMTVLNCSGSGFAPTARTGPGVNPLCGSKTLVTCTSSGLACVASTSMADAALRCR